MSLTSECESSHTTHNEGCPHLSSQIAHKNYCKSSECLSVRNTSFPNHPNGHNFINWLYCPECGAKGGLYGYSPDFELRCDGCDNELTVTLGQTPPFNKVKPRDIKEAAERHTENWPWPYQQINPARKLREMDDDEVARQLEQAGYHELVEVLEDE